MTAFPGQGAPVPGPRGQDGDKYAQWDAAYVLGSLSEIGQARIRGTPGTSAGHVGMR